MFKAVFRPTELVPLPDKIRIDLPTSYPEIAHLAPVEEIEEVKSDIEEYKGPTADDLRREAEMFKVRWEDEKEKMISSARDEANKIVQNAQKTAAAETKKLTDEAQVIKLQAEAEAKQIIENAEGKAKDIELEMKQNIDAERKTALEESREAGKAEGYAEGKAEVDRLIERTQTVLERAQDKRAEILSETEKQIIDLVLLIARKVIKVISENQRNVIISNVIESLRKIKSKGDITIRVNLADLKLATEHKEDFIRLIEKPQSLEIVEDTSVDSGGCIIETDFGEIDARIASQLNEMESKILEISPVTSMIKTNTPQPVIRSANLSADMLASSALMNAMEAQERSHERRSDDTQEDEEDEPLGDAANAALTASAALAALATMATKGRRDSDKKMTETIEAMKKKTSE